MPTELKKKIFILISGYEGRLNQITKMLQKKCDSPVIYTANDSRMGKLKIQNTPPDVVVVDAETEKNSWILFVETILKQNNIHNFSFIVIGHPPEEEKFLDEIVTGQISFCGSNLDEAEFSRCLSRALNFGTTEEASAFKVRYLNAGDILLKQNEQAEFVYIVRRGQLQAYIYSGEKKVNIGKIDVGEFVGEMAYINNEPRSANVEALKDSELIEIPIDHLDKILYQRPSWSKALMKTLTNRIKTANKSVKE